MIESCDLGTAPAAYPYQHLMREEQLTLHGENEPDKPWPLQSCLARGEERREEMGYARDRSSPCADIFSKRGEKKSSSSLLLLISFLLISAGCADGVPEAVEDAKMLPTTPPGVSPLPLDSTLPPLTPAPEQGAPLREMAPPSLDLALPRDQSLPLEDLNIFDDQGVEVDLAPLEDLSVDAAPVDQNIEPPPCREALEEANGQDDDCDGQVDEGTQLPCPRVAFEGRSYFFCDPDELSWRDARDECERWGYQLVVIENQRENEFIIAERQRQRQENLWIGLSDREDEGRWRWIDGSDLSFEAWGDGEPNDGGDGEDCAVILREDGRVGEWDDRGCGRLYDYACESPAAAE